MCPIDSEQSVTNGPDRQEVKRPTVQFGTNRHSTAVGVGQRGAVSAARFVGTRHIATQNLNYLSHRPWGSGCPLLGVFV